MTNIEHQILLNQLAIMAGLKNHMLLQHGNAPAQNDVFRFDNAISATSGLLRITTPKETET